MTWVDMAPPQRAPKRLPAAAVTIRVSKPGRYGHRAFVTVRPEMMDRHVSWWQPGQAVRVQFGHDRDTGKVRITSPGGWKLTAAQGRLSKFGKPNAVALVLVGLAGLPEDGRSAVPLAWEIDGDALIIDLPFVPKPAKIDGPTAVQHTDALRKIAVVTPRPPAAKPQAAPAPPQLAAASLSAPPMPVRPPLALPYQEILEWAIAHNCGTVSHGFDLAVVNPRRVKMNLRPVMIRKLPVRGAVT